jgi:hypothetical protein
VTESELEALDGSEAFERVDLLTVVMHEMANQLGLSDLQDAGGGRLLTWVLDLGVRRSPTSQDALLANFLFLYPQARRRW